MKLCKSWDIYHIKWCRISSINRICIHFQTKITVVNRHRRWNCSLFQKKIHLYVVGFFSTARFVHWSVLWPPTILKASQFDSGGSHQSKLLEFSWNHDCYSRDGGAHSRISLPKMPNPKELERTALVYELRNISQLENQG